MSQTTSHRGTGEAAVSLELPKPVAFRVRTGIKSYGYWTSDGSDFGYEKLFTESQLLTYVAKCVDEDLKEHDQRTADQCPHSTPYRYPCDQCNDEAQESGNGVTIRPSAAEVELRAEVERLRQSLHDIQKPGALNHFASRWDQINRILEAAGIEPDPDNWVNDVQTLVTERDQLRAELERVQTSRSAEGDRLDWLLQNLRGSVLRELVGEIGCTSDVAEWRSAIDRAAGFPQNSARK